MTDKDREAFETYYEEHFGDSGSNAHEDRCWAIWQACAAHYALKLTERGAVEICRDVYRTAKKGEMWSGIVTALKAAGVRFAEEA